MSEDRSEGVGGDAEALMSSIREALVGSVAQARWDGVPDPLTQATPVVRELIEAFKRMRRALEDCCRLPDSPDGELAETYRAQNGDLADESARRIMTAMADVGGIPEVAEVMRAHLAWAEESETRFRELRTEGVERDAAFRQAYGGPAIG